MVTIYKIKTSYPKTSRIAVEKVSTVTTVESYSEALQRVEHLTKKNKNENIRYVTGNIY